jgi:hypothetical protein
VDEQDEVGARLMRVRNSSKIWRLPSTCGAPGVVICSGAKRTVTTR